MGHKTLDAATQVMIRIRICADACVMHALGNGCSHHKFKRNRKAGREDTQSFFGWNSEEISPAQDRYASINWVQEGISERAELPDREVVLGFIVSETNLNGGDHFLCVIGGDLIMRDSNES
jgi:hypothetical protein